MKQLVRCRRRKGHYGEDILLTTFLIIKLWNATYLRNYLEQLHYPNTLRCYGNDHQFSTDFPIVATILRWSQYRNEDATWQQIYLILSSIWPVEKISLRSLKH